jgi:hypothetical protein
MRQVDDGHFVNAVLTLDQGALKTLSPHLGEEDQGFPMDHSITESNFPVAGSLAGLVTHLVNQLVDRSPRITARGSCSCDGAERKDGPEKHGKHVTTTPDETSGMSDLPFPKYRS